MASRRLLIHTVELYNYMGEIDDVATHQKTILRHCYCPTNEGIGTSNQGKTPKDSARLYVFDYGTIAESEDGVKRSYIPYSEWKELPDKSGYWTLNDAGHDFFRKVDSTIQHKVTSFAHKDAGTRRMWHFEVDGR